ncbi:TetR/AcrR family transcriptional regulator [Algihabitans albus]|uniref:TetR/AcrR family transcriptional regulator n=1 Tax=Algihabitans albus TaxID=2164067 RepID=UPI000E5D7348|nr:TetR family transcriptional regulator C-terminal domain-containing protein [Algihabitans albus]
MDDVSPHAGRPRSFDPDAVLDAALTAFHRYGLSAATYDVLERATGLHRQSLVYAFGDKRALFEAALRRYAERRVEEVVACLTAPGSPAAGIKGAFALWLEDARNEARRGCLLVNTAGEVGRRDEALADIVEAATDRLTAAFEEAFSRARAAGELRTEAAPQALADCAVVLGDGALLHARASGQAQRAEASIAAFLTTVVG